MTTATNQNTLNSILSNLKRLEEKVDDLIKNVDTTNAQITEMYVSLQSVSVKLDITNQSVCLNMPTKKTATRKSKADVTKPKIDVAKDDEFDDNDNINEITINDVNNDSDKETVTTEPSIPEVIVKSRSKKKVTAAISEPVIEKTEPVKNETEKTEPVKQTKKTAPKKAKSAKIAE